MRVVHEQPNSASSCLTATSCVLVLGVATRSRVRRATRSYRCPDTLRIRSQHHHRNIKIDCIKRGVGSLGKSPQTPARSQAPAPTASPLSGIHQSGPDRQGAELIWFGRFGGVSLTRSPLTAGGGASAHPRGGWERPPSVCEGDRGAGGRRKRVGGGRDGDRKGEGEGDRNSAGQRNRETAAGQGVRGCAAHRACKQRPP